MTVGYRFCGSCNPFIDTGRLFERLCTADPSKRYVYWEDGGYDRLLIISGCPRDCTSRPQGFSGEVIAVAGESIDGIYVPAGELVTKILDRLNA